MNSQSKMLTTLSDKELYNLCRKYGAQAKLWRQKFIGLLPEVDRRYLYLDKGFSSIFEFAAKLGGLSRLQTQRAIQIDKRCEKEGLDELREVFTNGEVSMHKMARVMSVANQDNEEEMVGAVKEYSKNALETFIRDTRYVQKSVPGHTFDDDMSQEEANLDFKLNDELIAKLNEMHNKGHDVNEILGELLTKREEGIQEEKGKVAEEIVEKEERKRTQGDGEVSRHIPMKVKRILVKEHGAKCSIPHCTKPAATFHHTMRFANHRTHDPRFIAPLCHGHHEVAHKIDSVYGEKRRR